MIDNVAEIDTNRVARSSVEVEPLVLSTMLRQEFNCRIRLAPFLDDRVTFGKWLRLDFSKLKRKWRIVACLQAKAVVQE